MNYKFTSIDLLLTKVIRDTKMQGEEAIYDMIEWAGEGLEQIGAYGGYIVKSKIFKVIDFRYPIPCDLISLHGIGNGNGGQLPMLTGTFDVWEYISAQNKTRPITEHIHETETFLESESHKEPVLFHEHKFTRSFLATDKTSTDKYSTNPLIKEGYRINNNHFEFNFTNKEVTITYLGVMIDERGYPMIPDLVSVREALSRYIVYKMNYGKFLTETINGNTYAKLEQDWFRYCRQARAEIFMPNLQQMEAIASSWLRLIPMINANNNHYTQTGANDKDNSYGQFN